MRIPLFVLLGVAVPGTLGVASPTPPPSDQIRGGETIVIHDPIVIAKPVKHYERMAPPYSDYAKDHDTWGLAWLVLDVSETGTVTRVKFLKRPGADLDGIAVRQAMSMKFEPAHTAQGRPMRSLLLWRMEWPSFWWMIDMDRPPTSVPDVSHVPCRGSGPWNFGSLHKVYRDCSKPDFKLVATAPWIDH